MPPRIYTIDFGTSNSLLAAAEPGVVHAPIPLDPLHADPTILRSLLYFPSQEQVFYGMEAIHQFSERQGMGRLIRSVKKQLPSRSFIGTWIDNRPLNLEDLIGLFLGEMRRRADRHFKSESTQVILGRPARFSLEDADDQYAESRLREAAKRAGFTHIEFCPEPVAAAYEYQKQVKGEKLVLVADFGGGTSDFTVIRLHSGAYRRDDVLSIGGVPIAGDILDGSVMRYQLSRYFGADVQYSVPFSSNTLTMPSHVMKRLCSPADISFLMKNDAKEFLTNVRKWAKNEEDRIKMDRLFCLVDDQLGFSVFEEIEAAKRRLSMAETTALTLANPGLEIKETLTRPQFEKHVEEPVQKILAALDETLRLAGCTAAQIDLVCCTGGTARVPLLNRALSERFGKEKVDQHNHFHSIVQGLTQYASQTFRM